MKFEIKGLDNLNRQLGEMQRKSEEASGIESVPIEELLSTSFMSTHTNFDSFTEMVEKSGNEPTTDEEWSTLLASKEWDTFISKNTLFQGWEALLAEAAKERIIQQLGFGE